jgi:hypothetical protein
MLNGCTFRKMNLSWMVKIITQRTDLKITQALSSFVDGGKLYLRTGLELCTCKRQARKETLTTRHLHVALTHHAIPSH